MPDDDMAADGAEVSDNEFALWLWGKAVEHNANLVCETVVEFLDKLAPGHSDDLDDVRWCNAMSVMYTATYLGPQ